MALEKLEEELYKEKSEELSRRTAPQGKESMSKKEGNAPMWREEARPEEEGKLLRAVSALPAMRKWVVGGIVMAVLALLGVGGFYFYLGLAAKGVSVSITNENEVLLGVPTKVMVNYANSGQTILKDAHVSLSLPDGVSFLDVPADERVETKDLGDLGAGSEGKEEFEVLALKNPQTVQSLSASIDYVVSQTGSRFEKDASSPLAVGASAIKVSVAAPEQVLSGEQFQIDITYENISQYDFSDVKMKLDYPPVFSFVKSSVPASEGNYLWNLGDLRAGAKGDIIVQGSATGKADAPVVIGSGFTVGMKGTVQRYAVPDAAPSAQLSISPSPLPIEIAVNNQAEYIASPGELLTYTIAYRNNTETSFKNAVLTAQLIGDMYNFNLLNSNGFFSSIGNTITWTAANTPAFANIGPGDSGSVSFAIVAKNEYPIRRLNDKNFTLKVNATLQSPTVPVNVAAKNTTSLADTETKVKGDIAVSAFALFRDANSGILNSGPIPPRVNGTTDYTVHWKVVNYSNDADRVEVRAYLQSGVTFTGQVKSNIVSVPTYNPNTQEVVWDIDHIPATKGVIGQPIEATFQIAATPSLTSVNQFMPLMSKTELSAHDSFTGLDLTAAAEALSTLLTSDPTISPQQGIVVNQ